MLDDYLRTHEAGPASHAIRFPRGSACRRYGTTTGRSSIPWNLLVGWTWICLPSSAQNSAAARPSVTLVDYRTHEAGPASHVIRFPRGPACRRFETTPGRSSSLGLPPAKLRGRKALGDQRFSSITQHWTRKSAATLGRRRQWAPPTRSPHYASTLHGATRDRDRPSCEADSDDRVSNPTRIPNRPGPTGQSAAGSRTSEPMAERRGSQEGTRLRPWVALPGPPPGTRTSPTQVRYTPLALT